MSFEFNQRKRSRNFFYNSSWPLYLDEINFFFSRLTFFLEMWLTERVNVEKVLLKDFTLVSFVSLMHLLTVFIIYEKTFFQTTKLTQNDRLFLCCWTYFLVSCPWSRDFLHQRFFFAMHNAFKIFTQND